MWRIASKQQTAGSKEQAAGLVWRRSLAGHMNPPLAEL
jgi:hypothetical protein